jgi:hypothetical protein
MTTSDHPNDHHAHSDETMSGLNVPRVPPRPPSADYASGWYAAASRYRLIADHATDRLIRERFYFAASLFVMLAALLLLTVMFKAAK